MIPGPGARAGKFRPMAKHRRCLPHKAVRRVLLSLRGLKGRGHKRSVGCPLHLNPRERRRRYPGRKPRRRLRQRTIHRGARGRLRKDRSLARTGPPLHSREPDRYPANEPRKSCNRTAGLRQTSIPPSLLRLSNLCLLRDHARLLILDTGIRVGRRGRFWSSGGECIAQPRTSKACMIRWRKKPTTQRSWTCATSLSLRFSKG